MFILISSIGHDTLADSSKSRGYSNRSKVYATYEQALERAKAYIASGKVSQCYIFEAKSMVKKQVAVDVVTDTELLAQSINAENDED